jgi:hypothetical protein
MFFNNLEEVVKNDQCAAAFVMNALEALMGCDCINHCWKEAGRNTDRLLDDGIVKRSPVTGFWQQKSRL